MLKQWIMSGRCLGLSVGKCNCGACSPLEPCSSDDDCGGLHGACALEKFCDCQRGKKHYFSARPILSIS